jgi:hypothetical protein
MGSKIAKAARILVALATIGCLAPPLAGAEFATITECDRLSSSGLNRDRPWEISGMEIKQTDASWAISVCLEALRAQPKMPRLAARRGGQCFSS